MVTRILTIIGVLSTCNTITMSSPAGFPTGTINNKSCEGRRCQLDHLCNTFVDHCVCNVGYIFSDNSNHTCVDLDECGQHFHDPCGHRGVCMNTVGSYTCACLQGWTSSNHCAPKVFDPALCMPGYTGESCNVNICGTNGYGEPVGDSDDFICVCNKGWTHATQKDPCDVDVNECIETPGICENGASCEKVKGTYKCHCLPGWSGTNCSQYNCATRACANSGVCDGGVCKCGAGWVGQDCRQSPTTTTTPKKAFVDNINGKTDQSEIKRYRLLLYISASVACLLLLLLLCIAFFVCIKTKKSKQQAQASIVTLRNSRVNPNKFEDSKSRIIRELSGRDPMGSVSGKLDDISDDQTNLYYFYDSRR